MGLSVDLTNTVRNFINTVRRAGGGGGGVLTLDFMNTLQTASEVDFMNTVQRGAECRFHKHSTKGV